MLRVSDRLPPRRRSGGGKHVATRPARGPWTWVARAGVAGALVTGLVLVVVDPSPDAAAAQAAAWRAEVVRQVGPSQAQRADAATTRADLADVATEAVTQTASIRAKAVQADVPADQLAALDRLQQQVDLLVTQVESPQRVSRSGMRAPDGPSTPPSSDAAASDRGATGDGSTGVSAQVEGQAAAASGAAGPATVATGGAAAPGSVPSGAVSPGPAPASTAGSGSAAPTVPGAADVTSAAPVAPGASPTATSSAGAPGPSASPVTPAGQAPDAAVPQIMVTDTASVEAALPTVTTVQDPAAAALRSAVLALAQQVAQVDAAADAAVARATAAAAQAAAQTAAQQAAAQKAAWKASLQGYANGRLPASALCAPSFDSAALLRCDAAEAIDAMDAAFAQAFGHHLTLNDSYRSYAAQVQCTRTRGWLCAVPGTSNHGLGIAVDIGDAGAYGTAAYAWLTAHGPAYGWHNPAWARPGGSKHEPWHWEYTG